MFLMMIDIIVIGITMIEISGVIIIIIIMIMTLSLSLYVYMYMCTCMYRVFYWHMLIPGVTSRRSGPRRLEAATWSLDHETWLRSLRSHLVLLNLTCDDESLKVSTYYRMVPPVTINYKVIYHKP